MGLSEDEVLKRDTETLHRLGYAQELSRRMSGFGNFAMSFMIIGIFWACSVSFQQGFSTSGMFGITGMFIVGAVVAYVTSASLGEIGSALPTAGGLYHWATIYGGRGWGWATAWINLLAYTFAVAGTAVSAYLLFQQMILGGMFNIDTSSWGYWQQAIGVAIIVGSQALLNHLGVRMLSRIGEIGAYLTFAASFALVGIMFYNIHPANFSQLLVFTNNTGDAGGGVVPFTSNPLIALGYAMLLPMWIITAYDASAHTSEETVDAARAVPKAMVSSVLLSAGVGILMLTSFALAMANPSEVAKQGSNAFAFLFGQIEAPSILKSYISITMVLAAYICGACALTGYSRATFAFSRDGGLPQQFRRVSKRFRTPAYAIWACAVVSISVTLYSSAFAALVGGIALFYQLCYGMTIAAALFARNRSYGPFRLGILSKPFAAIAIIGGIAVIYIGLQPPTDILINYFIGIIGALVVLWFAIERKRFPGPPVDAQSIAERQRDIRILEKNSESSISESGAGA